MDCVQIKMNQDLSGLPVKCPNCKKILFKTTDKYDPNVSPRGDMLKSLVTYHLDFLLTSSTPVSSLTCPECTCQLAPYGRLTVVNVPGNCGAPAGVCPAAEKLEALSADIAVVETPAPMEEVAPEANPKEAPNPLVCDICGKECKSQFGLNSHKRSHK